MKELKGHWGKWRSEALRNRYARGGWGGRALFVAAPWITLVLLMGLLLVVGERILLRPGVVFDLPRAPFREGMRYGLTAVMIPVARTNGHETLVFFDDEPFDLGHAGRREQLAVRLHERVALEPRREILLLADRRIPHGDVLTVVNLAREAGVSRVNVATKPD
ncbi:MAG: ExbD/TolR family protein [Kiritimatiellia bacterium]